VIKGINVSRKPDVGYESRNLLRSVTTHWPNASALEPMPLKRVTYVSPVG
jgi:hypothetical protein